MKLDRPVDETEIARRRMKHLAPWRVEPVPAVHAAPQNRPPAPLSQEARERCRRVALNVLAMQMAEAATRAVTVVEAD